MHHIPNIVELFWVIASVLPPLFEASRSQLIAYRLIRARIKTRLVGIKFSIERCGIFDQDHGVNHGKYSDDQEQYKNIVFGQIGEHVGLLGCDNDNALNANPNDYP